MPSISEIIVRLENSGKNKRMPGLLSERIFEMEGLGKIFPDVPVENIMSGWFRYRCCDKNIWACIIPESRLDLAESFADILMENGNNAYKVDRVLYFLHEYGDIGSTRLLFRNREEKDIREADKDTYHMFQKKISRALRDVDKKLSVSGIDDTEKIFCRELDQKYMDRDRESLLLTRIIMNNIIGWLKPSDIDFIIPCRDGYFHIVEFKRKSPAKGLYINHEKGEPLFCSAKSAQEILRCRYHERILESKDIRRVLREYFKLSYIKRNAIGLDLVHAENVRFCENNKRLLYDYIYFNKHVGQEERTRYYIKAIDFELLYHCRVDMSSFRGIHYTVDKDSGNYNSGPRIQLMIDALQFTALQNNTIC